MYHKTTRRRFLGTTAVVGVGYWVAGGVQIAESKSPNEKIAMAAIGVDGKGSSDSADAANAGVVVAICDVDEQKLGRRATDKRFEKAERFVDFRKMFDKLGKSIDAVTVSTPDHMHAAQALMAMRMNKHCFVQKPLTRCVYEARLLGEVARKMKVATQMGNQGTAGSELRKAAAMMRAGRFGNITEVHVWTNRPIWPQGGERPAPKDPPKYLHWDLWLGVAPVRPYAEGAYHPFAWRGWWDFGSGALGDMACHTVNMPFMGLDLRDPVTLEAETSKHNKDSFPRWSIIRFEFPANQWRGPVKMVWYDGGQRPSPEIFDGTTKLAGSGCIVIGSKGKLYHGGDYGGITKIVGDVDQSEIQFERSPGHFEEWIRAIRGGPPAKSNFPDYAGPLTETILLGNLAVWAAADGRSEKIEWDAKNLRAKNVPGLETVIKPVYRKGYVLDA